MPARKIILVCFVVLIPLLPATILAQPTGASSTASWGGTQTTSAVAPPPGLKGLGEPYRPPAEVRQGGDTFVTATVIPSVPYSDSGTTVGYNHDYTATCFSNWAPDVVYRLVVPAYVWQLSVSLCGSTYDTGLIVYDASLDQVDCNDDFCGLQSEIECMAVTAGATYFIVVTGYNSAAGAYTISVSSFVGCAITCQYTSELEGEPPLDDDYVDHYNGGCNTSPDYPFQHLPGALEGSSIPIGHYALCGMSGWYLSAGSQFRDTDWFTLTVGFDGVIDILADAEAPSYIFELGGTCEGGVAVVQQATIGPCAPAAMTITGEPDETKWFWIGPTTFVPNACDGDREYRYVVFFSGLMPEVIATESATWSAVKALYR
jgi:hypothetical protein